MKKKPNGVDPKQLRLHPKLEKAFDIDPIILEEIKVSMKENGFDKAFPIIVWGNGGNVVIDGHHRRRAAIESGLVRVPIIYENYESEKEALERIDQIQFGRRNLSESQKVKLLHDRKNIVESSKNKKEFISKLLKCSERQATKYLKVIRDDNLYKRVVSGENSVSEVTKSKNKKPADKKKKLVSDITKKLNSMTVKELSKIMNGLKI